MIPKLVSGSSEWSANHGASAGNAPLDLHRLHNTLHLHALDLLNVLHLDGLHALHANLLHAIGLHGLHLQRLIELLHGERLSVPAAIIDGEGLHRRGVLLNQLHSLGLHHDGANLHRMGCRRDGRDDKQAEQR